MGPLKKQQQKTKQKAKTVVLNCYCYRAMGPLKKRKKKRQENQRRLLWMRLFLSFFLKVILWIIGSSKNSSVGRASDWKARRNTDVCTNPRCGKGFFSQGQLSVQTLSRCLYGSPRVQSHASATVRTLKFQAVAAIPLFGHTKIQHTLTGMASAALAAAVPNYRTGKATLFFPLSYWCSVVWCFFPLSYWCPVVWCFSLWAIAVPLSGVFPFELLMFRCQGLMALSLLAIYSEQPDQNFGEVNKNEMHAVPSLLTASSGHDKTHH